MKRKVLCFFSFLLILLVFFTVVSPKAEDEMYTLVDARKGEGKGDRNYSVGTIAIVWENSNDRLFNIVEGDGWESGLRLAEIPSAYFDRYEGHVELGAGTEYWYVYSASREPVLGSAVSVVETERGEDTYLLWHPESISTLDRLPNSMDVIAHEGNVALISNWGATFPFFEHNVWYSLRDKVGEDIRCYSLTDVQQFLEALPWVAAVVVVLLSCLILCGASWILERKTERNKGALRLNILLIIGLLAVLPWMLGKFDLPASLMPQEFILDISHYIHEFKRIFSSLESMGNSVMKELWQQVMTKSAAVFGLGLAATAILIAIEKRVCNRCRGKRRLENNRR